MSQSDLALVLVAVSLLVLLILAVWGLFLYRRTGHTGSDLTRAMLDTLKWTGGAQQ